MPGLMWWSTKSGTRYACPNISQNRKHLENIPMVHGWPNQEWFPELLDLMIGFPLALSLVPKLLRQTFSQHFHPHSWNLNLHAWSSSKDFIRRDFSFSGSQNLRGIRTTTPPPSDIYPPPPPRRLPTAPQLFPYLSARGHSPPYNFCL